MNVNAALEIMAAVRAASPKGFMCVAGGLVRDLLLFRPIKDLDIFAFGVDADAIATKLDGASESREYDTPHVRLERVIDLPGFPLPVQVAVLRDDPVDVLGVISAFDIGLCQAGITEQDTVVTTQAFRTDALRKTLTIMTDPTRSDLSYLIPSTARRLLRLREKYQGYEVLDPNALLAKHILECTIP